MSTTIYLDVSIDGGKSWIQVKDVDLDYLRNVDVQFKFRFEDQSTTTTSTTLPTTTSTTTIKPNVYTISAPSNGILTINGGYKPGDTIQLRGKITYLQILNLNGSLDNPIRITTYPGEPVLIGNPSWNGSGYATAMTITNSHHIKMYGESKDKLVFTGSTQDKRTAYNSVYISQLTDNIEIYNWTLINGGTGFVCKTDPTTDPRTYGTGTNLSNFSFHDFEVYGTLHEGLYIGHTATYWDLTANVPFYGNPSQMDPTHKYVQPLMLNNVKIYNGYVHDVGYDGIQTAAIDGLEIFKNRVTNWATGKNTAHNGGILIGGRTVNTSTHDNIVIKGWGELIQFYGSGGNHIITNNLLGFNENDGVSMRGAAAAAVKFTNNTIAVTGGNNLRINGYTGQTGSNRISMNLFVAPLKGVGTIYPKNYVYLENGAVVEENSDYKYTTQTTAGLDANLMRLPTSPIPLGIGYQPTL